MATGSTAIADIIVPEIFTPIVKQMTENKATIITSGAATVDEAVSALLDGAGLTFDIPSFKPLDDEDENVSSDDTDDAFKDGYTPNTNSRPKKTGMVSEVGVRLSRNQSWASADLTAALGQKDPMAHIAEEVSTYWALRMQHAFIATMKGVFADNDAAPAASEHATGDLTFDISGGSFSDGVTNFSSEAFLDAVLTCGDSQEGLGMIQVHSVVANRMQKLQLIDFIPDAINPNVKIPFYLGRRVVINDYMPASSGVYQSWIFGAGAVRLGVNSPKVPTETARLPAAGNGGGQEALYNRVEWMIHPVGHAYVGTAPKGGPSNAATSNNLAHASSFQRVYPQRKQIKIARLITREA